MNNVTVENINSLVGSLYNPIRTVNRDVKSISLSGGDPILPDENKNINIPSYDGNPGLFDNDIYNELMSKIPTKLSELQNDSSYVQDNNYVHTDNNFTTSYKDKLDDTYQKNEVYTKQESYSKSEVDNKIASIVTTTFEVVDQLPEQGESNVIYLVPSEQAADNEYEEYIWVNNKWELIGTTRVDLTPYYTSSQIDQLLNPINENVNQLQQNKLNKNLGADNAGKHLGIDSDGNILPVDNVVTTDELTGALLGEQQARQKQDDLLQGEIDTKMAPSNIIAGDNIAVSQDGLNVTVRNTIPFKNIDFSSAGMVVGSTQLGTSNGSPIDDQNEACTVIGDYMHIGNAIRTVLVGRDHNIKGTINDERRDIVLLGISNSSNYSHSIALGNYITIEKENQFVLGSTLAPINEMKVVTSEGDKYIATTDQVKTYSAGSNVEITEDGVINNTIPYDDVTKTWSIYIGKSIGTGTPFGVACTNLGYNTSSGSSSDSVVIGSQAQAIAASYCVSVGSRASSIGHQSCITLGYYANATKSNQFTLGSNTSPINEMRVVTSTGEKFIATTDLIDALTQRIEALENANA